MKIRSFIKYFSDIYSAVVESKIALLRCQNCKVVLIFNGVQNLIGISSYCTYPKLILESAVYQCNKTCKLINLE